jgi:carbon monoxide dehydrogenase subunit G
VPTFEKSIEISAPPQMVWSLIADPSYVPKLYPHVIAVSPSHSRIATVGKSVVVTAKISGRKMLATLVATEVVPNKRFSYKHGPEGFLEKYVCSIVLEPTKKGTRVTERVEYDAHGGYLGEIASKVLVNRLVRGNIIESLMNLKELAELEEHPASRKA